MNTERQERVRVKICGITNREDAEAAIACGADALGFNLWRGSKRYIELDENADWIRGLPPFVTRVAVMVNPSIDEAKLVSEHPVIDLVQLHGDEDEVYCAEFARFGRPFIRALRLRDAADIDQAALFSTRSVLLDAHVPGEFGGTGTSVNLELAVEFMKRQPGLTVILAGGLTPENVSEAVRQVRPFGIDVASGVESSPGRKDIRRMRDFIAGVREA